MLFVCTTKTRSNNNVKSLILGNTSADQILTTLLSSAMLIGGVLGFVLDNIIPGKFLKHSVGYIYII